MTFKNSSGFPVLCGSFRFVWLPLTVQFLAAFSSRGRTCAQHTVERARARGGGLAVVVVLAGLYLNHDANGTGMLTVTVGSFFARYFVLCIPASILPSVHNIFDNDRPTICEYAPCNSAYVHYGHISRQVEAVEHMACAWFCPNCRNEADVCV